MINYISFFIKNNNCFIVKKNSKNYILLLSKTFYTMSIENDGANIQINLNNSILLIKNAGLKNIKNNEKHIRLYQKLINYAQISWEIYFFWKNKFYR